MVTATLSPVELTAVARARRLSAVAGPSQARLLGTALVGFLVIDYARLILTSPETHPVSSLMMVMDLLAYAAMGVTLWRPRTGLAIAAIPLLTALGWESTSMDAVLLFVVTALSLARLRRQVGLAVTALVVLYVGARLALYRGDHRLELGLTLGISAALGLVIGWAVLAYRRRRDNAEQALLGEAAERARIRADERRLLSRELHDVVAHQLTTASLQAMGCRDSDDLARLRRALVTVERATGEALAELRVLVGVLRDDPATTTSGTEIRELAERVPPTQAAAEVDRLLMDVGWESDVVVPASADIVEMTVQRTISRALHDVARDGLRYGVDRGRLVAAVHVTEHVVTLTAGFPPRDDVPIETLLRQVHGLRERVDLTGGRLAAALDGSGRWSVSLSLPRG